MWELDGAILNSKTFFRRISLNVDVGVYKSLKTDKYPCYTKEELEEKGKHYLSR